MGRRSAERCCQISGEQLQDIEVMGAGGGGGGRRRRMRIIRSVCLDQSALCSHFPDSLIASEKLYLHLF